MYSGITGQEFAADIYLGVVYYQRLRHMVNDKFQVRTTGPVDQLTRQPVKVTPTAFLGVSTLILIITRGGNALEESGSEKWSAMLSLPTVLRSCYRIG